MAQGLIAAEGGQPQKQPRYAPLFLSRSFSGYVTNRSVLHDAAQSIYEERWFGGRNDALWAGMNVELTNHLTIQRRPGLIPFSSVVYPTSPLDAFSFSLLNGTTQMIIDCGSSPSLAISGVTSYSNEAYYHYASTQPNVNYAGMQFQVLGCSNATNNGTFVCVASSTTNLILRNLKSVTETGSSATAQTAGAVYYDHQPSGGGGCTLLFAKQPGAGQTHFSAVAGILYAGDGVDTWMYTPGVGATQPNGNTGSFGIEDVWNWSGMAPTYQPGINILSSGAESVPWAASTYFTTMGLLIDPNNNVQQLISVNANGTNPPPAVFGIAGAGQPPLPTNNGGTYTESGSTLTWTCQGQITTWQEGQLYQTGQPVLVMQAVQDSSKPVPWIFVMGRSSATTSSGNEPNWTKYPFSGCADGSCSWVNLGVIGGGPPYLVGTWQQNTHYSLYTTFSNPGVFPPTTFAIVYPLIPTADNVAAAMAGQGQATYLYAATTAGISASGYTPWSGITSQSIGDVTPDTNPALLSGLTWQCLGPKAWSAGAGELRTAWVSSGCQFSCILDPNGNMQVCITAGTSQSSITGIVWGTLYGSITRESTGVEWVCVGPPITTWVSGAQWCLPTEGFSPPTSSQKFGGPEILVNGYVHAVVGSGETGTTEPSFPNPTMSVSLSGVTNNGTTATYAGSFTNGGSNAFVGYYFTITGCTSSGNNGTFVCTASSSSSITLNNPYSVSESESSAKATFVAIGSTIKDGTVYWQTISMYSANTLAWSYGHCYAYSFYSRLLNDPYNTSVAAGGFGGPPGLVSKYPNGLGIPIGSQTGNLTTASPYTQITGANSGAIVQVIGYGPTDPQFDTIIIWRSPDMASGSDNMLWLTEFPAPPAIKGTSQTWTFNDYLPDAATTIGSGPTAITYPGLNVLMGAPIDDVNDPPPSNFLPMVYNLERIWGTSGIQVLFSGGPDVQVGNANSAFNPDDEFTYLQNPVRAVKTSQGLAVFLPGSIEFIAGGPLTASFYPVTIAPGIGLGNYNALDQHGGEITFLAVDKRLMVLTSSLDVAEVGYAIADRIVATIFPNLAYLAELEVAQDQSFYLADGQTGWYRCWPRTPQLAANGISWSPFAEITNGCKMVRTAEITPGLKKLLVGPNGSGQILMRDLTTFTDNETEYDAWFTVGALMLAHPGQTALCKFLEFDFAPEGVEPEVSYLMDEISGDFTPFTAEPEFDPPVRYGATLSPASYSPLRFYFAGTGQMARCRHLQVTVDFGTDSSPDEMINMTVYGRQQIEA
jgi:hypothetical protein